MIQYSFTIGPGPHPGLVTGKLYTIDERQKRQKVKELTGDALAVWEELEGWVCDAIRLADKGGE